MSVFVKQKKSHLKQPMFFGDSVDIQRYDRVKYPQFDKFTEKMNGLFWRPQEIDLTKDTIDFKKLSSVEEHIFTSNLKRQILLDSVQGRSPNLAFLPICSLPELEAMFQTWAYFETIHSRSYTHILQNVYPNPSEVFDTMLNIKEITQCAADISRYYDDLIDGHSLEPFERKKRLYLAMVACNILEGIRFYVSFACSWAFAENKKMDGNAQIIKLICRDENIHLAASTAILKQLVKEDKDYAKIATQCDAEVLAMFQSAVDQEKAWADYLFKDGSILGLNSALLKEYVDWIAAKRMRALGLTSLKSVSQANPLPWTENWIGGSNVQVAPQETQITSYKVGAIKNDLDTMDLASIDL